jgi:pantetheine-phosphate adenylyltransferase
VYPGSFDPITNGHLDIVGRSLRLFDQVVVAIAYNARKASPLFELGERVTIVRDALSTALPDEARQGRVVVECFEGLLVDYVRDRRAQVIVRGLRAVADFEYEFQFAHMNRRLEPGIEMIFMMTNEENFYISSSMVKEVASLGGNVDGMVPPNVARELKLRAEGVRSGKVEG